MSESEAPICQCCGEKMDWNGESWVCLTAVRASQSPHPLMILMGGQPSVPTFASGKGVARRTIKARTAEME